MYTLKVPFELSLSYWSSRTDFQQLVVRHAICCGSAWYAYMYRQLLCIDLDSLMCIAQLSVSRELFAKASMCCATLRRITSTLHRYI
jgi:hypothetical protein